MKFQEFGNRDGESGGEYEQGLTLLIWSVRHNQPITDAKGCQAFIFIKGEYTALDIRRQKMGTPG